MKPLRIILASASVYRRGLLERLQLPFDIEIPAVDESPLSDESAMRTALRLAEMKARAVTGVVEGALVIGSDQVAEAEGARFGKPGNHAAAVAQLQALRGKKVTFHTAVCLFNAASGRAQTANVPTAVTFRHYTDGEIERYLRTEKPYDCAGSAKIEGLGIALVERVVSDDPTALIGLPLVRLTEMLRNEGVQVP